MNKFAPLFVILGAALWGVDGIVLRPALYTLPVPLVVFVESSLITLLLLPILIWHRASLSQLSRRDWLAFGAVAVLGGAVGTMAITRALFYVNFVNLSVVVLIQKLQPVFAILLAALLLKEKPTRPFFKWAALAIFGAYLMTFGARIPHLANGDQTTAAAFYAMIAVVSFGAATVFSKRALRNVPFELGTFLRFSFTAVVMLGIVLFTGDLNRLPDIQTSQIVVFLLIALTTGGPAIFLYYYGLKQITASVATICELAFPLTAIILEYSLRENMLDPFQWIGVAILLLAILRVTRVNSPPLRFE